MSLGVIAGFTLAYLEYLAGRARPQARADDRAVEDGGVGAIDAALARGAGNA